MQSLEATTGRSGHHRRPHLTVTLTIKATRTCKIIDAGFPTEVGSKNPYNKTIYERYNSKGSGNVDILYLQIMVE